MLRDSMGSWAFVIGFILIMGVWIIVNSAGPRWDPYPFILLNLILSMIAGLQGAILLIAAKRQDQIAAALARNDYDTNVAAKEDVERLIQLAERNELQLQTLSAALRDRLPAEQGKRKSARRAE